MESRPFVSAKASAVLQFDLRLTGESLRGNANNWHEEQGSLTLELEKLQYGRGTESFFNSSDLQVSLPDDDPYAINQGAILNMGKIDEGAFYYGTYSGSADKSFIKGAYREEVRLKIESDWEVQILYAHFSTKVYFRDEKGQKALNKIVLEQSEQFEQSQQLRKLGKDFIEFHNIFICKIGQYTDPRAE